MSAAAAPRLAMLARRSGYRPAYRVMNPQPCPGCGQAQWLIGRATAECALCGTALPLAGSGEDKYLAR